MKNIQARLKEILAELEILVQQEEILHRETEQRFREKHKQSHAQLLSLEQEIQKQQQILQQYQLRSPVTGRLHQLTIHGVGSVVTPAQELMKIVPVERSLKIEAFIKNSDIGFVETGQPVEVKVDAFPFTRYGVLEGKVQSISSDAIQDDQKGLVYKSIITLQQDAIDFNGRELLLAPGMSVSAEVITGKRHLIDYFLSPLKQYGDESARER